MATNLLISPLQLTVSKISVSTKKVAINSQRATRFVVKASSGDSNSDEKTDEKGFTPFGFVTDNPSSRSAIQLPESPAEDGNVGQMLYRTEDKGKEYGSYIKSGKLRWFVRETGSPESRRGTVVFLHGAPTQSYSYRVVMSQGFGFSDKPQPGYGFDYTEKEFHEALDKLLGVVEVKSPFFLVVQDLRSISSYDRIRVKHVAIYETGAKILASSYEHPPVLVGFIVGSYGLTWALKNPEKISKLAILNTPLTVSSPTPGLFQQLRIPLYGEFTSQNAVMAERFIEAGSPYVLKLEKADVYRLPYLASSGPGFALLEAARKINIRDILSQISDGFASGRWDKQVLIVWGIADKYLPQSIAEEFRTRNPDLVKLKLIEGAGHMPQEDWPEKVVDALKWFF